VSRQWEGGQTGRHTAIASQTDRWEGFKYKTNRNTEVIIYITQILKHLYIIILASGTLFLNSQKINING
jgi:hypothetical protein